MPPKLTSTLPVVNPGRPVEQDAEQRALGRIPASEAAARVKRHISRLYRAREAGKLPMIRVGSYWYVEQADLDRVYPPEDSDED